MCAGEGDEMGLRHRGKRVGALGVASGRAGAVRRRRPLVVMAGLAALISGLVGMSTSAVATASKTSSNAPQWASGGQDLSNSRSQPNETTISVKKASALSPRWTLNMAGDVSATPAVVNGVVYVPDWGGNMSAIDASNGKVIWQHQISYYNGYAGTVSRTDPVVDGNTVIIGTQTTPVGAEMIAINATTGAKEWVERVDTFGLSVITGSPIVYQGVVYVGISSLEEGAASNPGYQCCQFRGAIVALNESDGAILWKTYTMPDATNSDPATNNYTGGDTNPVGTTAGAYTGGAVWDSTPVIDPATNSVYVGTGNNYTVTAAAQQCVDQNGTSDTSCTASNDYFDSVLSLNLQTGHINWAHKVEGFDAWTAACLSQPTGVTWCPSPEGPDYDFGGAGPNLFTTTNPATGQPETLVGVGQKSGIYWAWNAATGAPAWNQLVGPGSALGGMEWGTATDGTRIYVADANFNHTSFTLGGSGPEAGQTCTAGSWAALDPSDGHILWQTCDPQGAPDTGAVSVANGVVFAGSMAETGNNMYALDAATGAILWSFASGGSVAAGPAIVAGSVYWGSGYSHFGLGSSSKKLYAFGVPGSS